MWKYSDGGRSKSGRKGDAHDCVVRAIALALELPYQEVYDELFVMQKDFAATSRSKKGRQLRHLIATGRGSASPRDGVHREVYQQYLAARNWRWTPTMGIGTGCRVHLRKEELPEGRLIVAVSRHLTTVIDGVIWDTHDPTREGTRCVYGYYQYSG